MNSYQLNKAARIISDIFIPPVFTILIFTYLAFYIDDVSKKYAVIFVSYLFGFILPVLIFYLFRRNGHIADADARIKEERNLPFILGVLLYLSGLITFLIYKVDIITTAFWFCYISNTILIILINKYWKISVHTAGVSGAMAAMFYLNNMYSIFIIILILVGWSRIQLKCHNIYQVSAGALLGFFSTLVQINFIVNNYAG